MGAIIFLRSPLWCLFFFFFFYCLFQTCTEVDWCASSVYYRVIFTIALDLFFFFFFILLNIVSMFVVDFIFIYCFAELSHSFKTLLMHLFVNQIFWKLYTFTFLFFFFFPRFTLVFLRCFLIVDGNLHGSTCPSFHSNISMRNGPL